MTDPTLTAQLATDLYALHAAGRIAEPWLPGMLLTVRPDAPNHVTSRRKFQSLERYEGFIGGTTCVGEDVFTTTEAAWLAPDLSDPLTVAGLIVLVREAADAPGLTTVAAATRDGLTWGVIPEPHDQPLAWDEPTEAAALCAALHLLATHPTT